MQEKTSPRFLDRPDLTIPELLLCGDSKAPAILAPDRRDITFGELRQQVYALARDLATFGLGKERIAIVMENGPDLVLALLAAATCGVAVPLNPKYRESEFSFSSQHRTLYRKPLRHRPPERWWFMLWPTDLARCVSNRSTRKLQEEASKYPCLTM